METYEAEQAGTIELDPAAREMLADPLAKLEHVDNDKRKAAASASQIQALRDESSLKHKYVAGMLSQGVTSEAGQPCLQPGAAAPCPP